MHRLRLEAQLWGLLAVTFVAPLLGFAGAIVTPDPLPIAGGFGVAAGAVVPLLLFRQLRDGQGWLAAALGGVLLAELAAHLAEPEE